MNRKIQIMAGVVLGLFLSGCAASPQPKAIRLLQADAGKTMEVAKEAFVEVTLRGNPTTGYSWQLLRGNDAVLKPAGDAVYSQDPAPKGKVGVGGKFTFRFQAIETGTAQLKFGYLRPWEKNLPPADAFEVTIRVR